MPSLRARLLNAYLRATFRKLPLPDIAPDSLRRAVERRVVPLRPKGVTVESLAGPVRGDWNRAAGANPSRTILYLHGGGYVFGSPRTHRALTTGLAAASGADLFSLDYRLAPEHPCPAAIDDAEAAYEMLLAAGRAPGGLVVMGDSAGGGLALALLQRLKAKGRPLPAGAVLYSPWTDLTAGGASMISNAGRDAMFKPDSLRRGATNYAGALPLDDPRVSPLFGSMEGLPPLLVFASRDELLHDDSVRLVAKARAAGVDARLVEEDGLVHVWPLFLPLIPEARTAVEASAAFARARGRSAAQGPEPRS